MKTHTFLAPFRVLWFALLALALLPAGASAAVIAVSFDMGPDGNFTPADGNLSPMVATPNTVGSVGRYASGLNCFGNGIGNFSGSPQTSGFFNINSAGSGNFSRMTTFPPGAVIDASRGLTGWGIISGTSPGNGLVGGTYNFGFRTTTGNFGWMNVTLNEGGTPNAPNNDVITINQAFVETVVGAPITVGAGALEASSASITSDLPDPSATGVAVPINVSVTGVSSQPASGQVVITATTGETCTDLTASAGPGNTALFSCSITFNTVGARNLTAAFSASATHANSTSAVESHTVVQATTSTITGDLPDPSVIGQSVTIDIDVIGSTTQPTDGQVVVTATTLETCTDNTPSAGPGNTSRFSCAIAFGTAGPRNLTAAFSGSATHGNSTSAAQAHAVSATPITSSTTITFITPATSQTIGIPYAVSVSVTGAAPTGTVAVGDGDGNTCTITLPATNCSLTSTSLGAKTITASYSGDAFNTLSADTEPYTITANGGSTLGLQAGSITLPATAASPTPNPLTTVTFAQPFNAIPVVIVQTSDEDAANPKAVRIRNVTATGFQVLQVQAPCAGCTGAGSSMTVHWLAATPGSYRLTQDTAAPAWAPLDLRGSGPGALLKVGAITTTATQRSNLPGGFATWPARAWDSVSFPPVVGFNFLSAPVVLTTIQSWNNEGLNLDGVGLVGPSQPWATSVTNAVGTGGFQIALDASEVFDDDTGAPGFTVGETIGYVAVEAGVSQSLVPLAGLNIGLVSALSTAARSSCTLSSNNFPGILPLTPANFLGFVGKQSRAIEDGGWLRRCNLSSSGGADVTVGTRVEDDNLFDPSANKGGVGGPPDTIGVLALSGPITTTPVTLAKLSVNRVGQSLDVRFSTATEAAQLGFRVWGRADARSQWQLLSPQMIVSSTADRQQAQQYATTLPAPASIQEVRIEDIDILGASRFHLPVAVGSSRGEDPIDASINWAGIRSANALVSVRSASTSTVATALAKVTLSGVQRITADALIAVDARFANADASELAVLDGTQPIARHVSCASLQTGCAIEFLGTRRESTYGSDNTYTVTLNANAVRSVRSGHAAPGTGVRRTFTDTFRHAPNVEYSASAPASDGWYDARIVANGAPGSASRSFTLAERVAGPVQLSVDVWGGIDFPDPAPDHHVQIRVNGQQLADRVFDGLAAARIEVAIPEALLTANNTLEVVLPRDTGYVADLVLLDQFNVSYPRQSRVSAGELAQGTIDPATVNVGGEFADGFETASASGPSFMVDGHAAGAVLWSVVGGEIRRDELAAGPVLLPATSTQWRLADASARRTPTLAAAVDGYTLPAQVDYLIVTHPLFESGLQPLVALQQSRGLATAVLRTDAIYATHSDHANEPAAIEAAIAAAVQRGARFVLIVGGDSYDYHDYLGIGSQSYVPTWYTATSSYIFHAPTDHPFADLDGDGRPEVAIGRLPVRSTVELQRAIASTVARGNAVATRYLAVAGASQPGEHFAQHSRTLLSYLRQGQQRTYALSDEIGTGAARNLAREGLAGSADWVSYLGHSSPNRWAFDNLLDTSQLGSITRTGAPAIVSQWGCWNNAFALPQQDTMAHALMLRANPLAATVIGASSLVEDASVLALGTRFFDLVEDGRMHDWAGLPTTTIGEAMRQAKRDLIDTDPVHTPAVYSIQLFGDPAAPL